MAVGILFISQTPGFNIELTNFLIGNILWVHPHDLNILFLDIFILLTVMCLHKSFLAICFDEEQAQLQGLPVNLLYLLLLVLTAVSIVLLIQVVGILLVMTMLTIPAAIANLVHRTSLDNDVDFDLHQLFILSLSECKLAYYLDWPGELL